MWRPLHGTATVARVELHGLGVWTAETNTILEVFAVFPQHPDPALPASPLQWPWQVNDVPARAIRLDPPGDFIAFDVARPVYSPYTLAVANASTSGTLMARKSLTPEHAAHGIIILNTRLHSPLGTGIVGYVSYYRPSSVWIHALTTHQALDTLHELETTLDGEPLRQVMLGWSPLSPPSGWILVESEYRVAKMPVRAAVSEGSLQLWSTA